MLGRRALALLLAAPLALGGAPAHAATPDPTGPLCGFSSLTWPGGDWQYGEVDGGPLALVDPDDPGAVVFGSVTCTLQTDSLHGTTSNDLASLTGSTTPGVAAVAGTLAYEAEPGVFLYLCTQVNVVGGPTLYWDEDWSGGSWSTSSDARCSGPGIGPEPEPFPPPGLVDAIV